MRTDLVEFLLNNGSDPDIKDNDGHSARTCPSLTFNPELKDVYNKWVKRQIREKRKETGTPWICGFCGREDKSNKKCTGCYFMWYCNSDCQIKHREQHSSMCQVKINISTCQIFNARPRKYVEGVSNEISVF